MRYTDIWCLIFELLCNIFGKHVQNLTKGHIVILYWPWAHVIPKKCHNSFRIKILVCRTVGISRSYPFICFKWIAFLLNATSNLHLYLNLFMQAVNEGGSKCRVQYVFHKQAKCIIYLICSVDKDPNFFKCQLFVFIQKVGWIWM